MPMRNCYADKDGRPLLEIDAAVAVSSEVEAGCHQRYDVLPVVAVACSAWIGRQRGFPRQTPLTLVRRQVELVLKTTFAKKALLQEETSRGQESRRDLAVSWLMRLWRCWNRGTWRSVTTCPRIGVALIRLWTRCLGGLLHCCDGELARCCLWISELVKRCAGRDIGAGSWLAVAGSLLPCWSIHLEP
ncbi:hypothetical protein MLD38_005624 [Melastoma candidum]|uniref:Uncharacterized protein n=1 Tax=Melastoma candidum TaxID=119954 RepID=A0ACB9RPD0_9MYRT|nr:hypothetical protein MLD38_005624 [Melastoma candidum]